MGEGMPFGAGAVEVGRTADACDDAAVDAAKLPDEPRGTNSVSGNNASGLTFIGMPVVADRQVVMATSEVVH